MKFEAIENCRLCRCMALEPVFDLGVQALSTRFPGPDEPDAERVPLSLVQCEDCGLVQLAHDYDAYDLYRRGYGYRSGVNQTMRNHLAGIVRQLETHVPLAPGDTVLDIASNDGTLLNAYTTPGVNKVGIDPTIEQYRDLYCGQVFVAPDFFSAEVFRSISPKPTARLISSIAVFYDVPDPNAFVADVAAILDPGAVWVLEQSYLPLLLENLAFDSICHEHLGYYCVKQLQQIISAHGLRIFELEENGMNGGSIRLFMCHQDAEFPTNTQALDRATRRERAAGLDSLATFKTFHAEVMKLGDRLLEVLTDVKAKGRTVQIYGASTKGNVILQLFGIDRQLIDAAAERNEWKWGRRTPGTNIPIISEEQSRAAPPDYFLVLPWHFRDEFIEREAEFIAQGGKLIFPLPDVEIYPAN